MKFLALGLIVSLFTSLQALAAPSATLNGVDAKGNACQVRLELGDILQVSLLTKDFTFKFINLNPLDDGSLTFEETVYEVAKHEYMPPVGAIITIGKIGVLDISGEVTTDSNGQFKSVSWTAQGGLLNWWKRSFVCSDLK